MRSAEMGPLADFGAQNASPPSARRPCNGSPERLATHQMRVFRLLLAVSLGLSTVLILSCTPKHRRSDALSYSDNAKRAYDKALEAYFDGNWEVATQQMEGVRAEYGYSRYSRLAELRLAEIGRAHV